MSNIMEDDYAPATRSMIPSVILPLLLVALLVVAIVWRKRSS